MIGLNRGIGWGLLALTTLTLSCAGRQSTEPILIGVLAPRTGPDKRLGESMWQGAHLAQLEVDGQNLIHGRTVRLQQGDTGAGPDSVRAVASRLVHVNKAEALLAGLHGYLAERLGSIAEEGHVPLVTPVALPGTPNAFVIPTAASPAERGQVLAQFALVQKVRQAVILVKAAKQQGIGVHEPLREGFQKAFQAGGGMVTSHSYTNQAELKKLFTSDSNADTVVLVGDGADLAALPRDNAKGKRLILCASAEGEVSILPQRLHVGAVCFVTCFWLDQNAAAVKDFTARYRTQFNQAPDRAAAIAYDDARLLFEGMRQAERLEPVLVRDSLNRLSNFASLTGPVSIRNGWARRTIFVLRLVDGKATLAQAFPPAP